MPTVSATKVQCYHCGEDCVSADIRIEDKVFCCEGCRIVFKIISKNGLCDYYDLNQAPGINQRLTVRSDKFSFLDDQDISRKLISFQDETQTHAMFYLPQIHCSSCLYLLENLHKLDPGVLSSQVNFVTKEIKIALINKKTTLRKAAELLTSIGYEPYISFNDLQTDHRSKVPADKGMIYQLGVAGFCFGNIMLMSFPEYLGIDASEEGLRAVFRWANLFLALPVLLFSAQPFYQSAWNGLKHKFLNIDAPIALAILITFIRSAHDIVSGSGGGYFDSMTGIVFFMLIGRILQQKTYRQLSFERDYRSYFPIAVSVLRNGQEIPTSLPNIHAGDTLLIHNEELVPADGILTRGKAFIDYSFVTGESLPVLRETGEIVYAGGKQTGANIELLVVKEVNQSYLTSLWGREELTQNGEKKSFSFVHALARYFTYILLCGVVVTAIYWWAKDPSKIWPVVTAMLIIACPCALLLSNTFTNGNVLRLLGRNHFYLRNAQAIEDIARANQIVFDKTGTLTSARQQDIVYEGESLTIEQRECIASVASSSSHPLSRSLAKFLGTNGASQKGNCFKEVAGEGISGQVGGHLVALGSRQFITGSREADRKTAVYVSFENEYKGHFQFRNHYREPVPSLVEKLKRRYPISIISGDNENERENLLAIFGTGTRLLFNQKPEDKLQYIKELQALGKRVIMIGDGLNDAGALKQANAGIALSEESNNFTPASDAIIESSQLSKLDRFIMLCKANRAIVISSFILSIVYNFIGLSFAVRGTLSPLIAAILMPSSSLTILLITFGSSNLLARWMKLS